MLRWAGDRFTTGGSMLMKRVLGAFIMLSAVGAQPVHGQERSARVHKLEELRWPQIDALDRERTLFILPIGMIEEHGPHLPVGADTYGVLFEADRVTTRVSLALPEWSVVLMPPLHYGEGGANEMGGKLVHPGTYGIRQSTLRSLVADIGAQVAQNGFRWIFVLTGHGPPHHSIAINDACDFVSESFGVTMVHVSGLFRAAAEIQSQGERIAAMHFSAADIASFGLDVHAGVSETSAILALRPDLVEPGYKRLPGLNGRTREELWKIATAPGWPGYLSSPAKATAAYGRAVEAWWVEGLSDLIVRAARGESFSQAPRAPEPNHPALVGPLRTVLENERAFEMKLQEWLDRRRRQ
jgi:creatinine amidohydrolase/Fe(II)-dependent formamide hydrolase-like protein